MWFQNFFKSLTSTPTRRRLIRRRSPASRLSVEALEDRCLPSFLPAVSYPVGAEPNAVVTGAFRGAGQPVDLAVANFGSNSVSVLLGNADGTFQPSAYRGFVDTQQHRDFRQCLPVQIVACEQQALFG